MVSMHMCHAKAETSWHCCNEDVQSSSAEVPEYMLFEKIKISHELRCALE